MTGTWEDDAVAATTLMLTKYHGLGNDFLVLVDPERSAPYDAATVAAVCDRHRGIGADGVLRLSLPRAGGDVAMELRNADGSEAETSGNGLRCAILAAAHAGMLPPGAFAGAAVAVETKAGPALGRLLRSGSADGPGSAGPVAEVSVAMGEAVVEVVDPSPVVECRALHVDVGNPHLVLLADVAVDLDLAAVGPMLEGSRPGGINVEVVRLRGCELDLVVWERGAGLTLACGTGSCAAAAAARAQGRAGDRVVVHNPGGDLAVELSGPRHRPSVTLVGPACRIGEVRVDLEVLSPPARVASAAEAPA